MWFKDRYFDEYYKAISMDKYKILIGTNCSTKCQWEFEFKWVNKERFILIGTDEDMKNELMGG